MHSGGDPISLRKPCGAGTYDEKFPKAHGTRTWGRHSAMEIPTGVRHTTPTASHLGDNLLTPGVLSPLVSNITVIRGAEFRTCKKLEDLDRRPVHMLL